MAIETGAAEALALLVARQPSPSCPATEHVRDVLTVRVADLNGAPPRDYRRLDTVFHLTIAELTGSSLLAAAATDARMRLNDLLNAIPILQRNIDHTAVQHSAIVGAILAGDPEGARRPSPGTWKAPPRCSAASSPDSEFHQRQRGVDHMQIVGV